MGSSSALIRRILFTIDRTPVVVDIALVVALRLATSVWLRHRGFSHVSDDDYARVVTAQLFAFEPKLDPSGTSWLPFPFWVTGSVMRVFGRSLEVAESTGIALGALAAVPPQLAALAAGFGRKRVFAAILFASLVPWNAWLAATVVPESYTHGLIAAAILGCATRRIHVALALGILVASLSRYEAWPVALGLAAIAAYDGLLGPKDGRMRAALTCAIAVAGPLSWMAWNQHVHGSATHFAARVAAYRQAIGAASIPLFDKVFGYPRALWTLSPTLTLGAIVALGILAGLGRAKRLRLPLTVAAFLLAFLVYGDLNDGAPTHHAERALTALAWFFAVVSADGIATYFGTLAPSARRSRYAFVGVVALVLGVWGVTLPSRLGLFPARALDEDRTPQLRRGGELRALGVGALALEPCAYEHFALIAAYRAPERVTSGAPAHRPVNAECPVVHVRAR